MPQEKKNDDVIEITMIALRLVGIEIDRYSLEMILSMYELADDCRWDLSIMHIAKLQTILNEEYNKEPLEEGK